MDKIPVYLVRFSGQYELTSTFMRFQEHYESPKFRGRIFSWEEFMDWYAKSNGNFTYFQDWNGFNIPSSVLTPFYAGKFDPLMQKEKKLLKAFQNTYGNFYIIVTWRNDGALRHEIAHGFFYLYRDYRRRVRECIRCYDTSVIRKDLSGCGYHPAVFADEINAYLLTGIEGIEGFKNIKLSDVGELRSALNRIFMNFFGYRLADKKDSSLLRMIHRVTF